VDADGSSSGRRLHSLAHGSTHARPPPPLSAEAVPEPESARRLRRDLGQCSTQRELYDTLVRHYGSRDLDPGTVQVVAGLAVKLSASSPSPFDDGSGPSQGRSRSRSVFDDVDAGKGVSDWLAEAVLRGGISASFPDDNDGRAGPSLSSSSSDLDLDLPPASALLSRCEPMELASLAWALARMRPHDERCGRD
jgi:hypothetical protein